MESMMIPAALGLLLVWILIFVAFRAGGTGRGVSVLGGVLVLVYLVRQAVPAVIAGNAGSLYRLTLLMWGVYAALGILLLAGRGGIPMGIAAVAGYLLSQSSGTFVGTLLRQGSWLLLALAAIAGAKGKRGLLKGIWWLPGTLLIAGYVVTCGAFGFETMTFLRRFAVYYAPQAVLLGGMLYCAGARLYLLCRGPLAGEKAAKDSNTELADAAAGKPAARPDDDGAEHHTAGRENDPMHSHEVLLQAGLMTREEYNEHLRRLNGGK